MVLDITGRQPPDRRSTEADQRIAIIRGVALKIPSHRAVARSDCELIVRQRKMIEPDARISGLYKLFRDGFGLLVSLFCIRKRRFIYEALVLLEGRYVSITENGETLRTQLRGQSDGFDAGLHGLFRKTVYQIEVDTRDAHGA